MWDRKNRRHRREKSLLAKEKMQTERDETKLKALISDVGSLAFGQMQDSFREHFRKEIAPEFASLLDYQLVVFSIHSTLAPKFGGDLVDLVMEFIPETFGEWLEFRGSNCFDVAEKYAHEQYTGDRLFDAHFLRCAYDVPVMNVHTEYDKHDLTFNLT